MAVIGFLSAMAATVPAAPIPLILDTDEVWDAGDMDALAFLHGMADQCDIKVLAVTAVTTQPNAAGAVDAVNRYYNRPNIPVGALKGDSFLSKPGYVDEIVKKFPNRYSENPSNVPDAVQVFRQTLAKQPDTSVVVVAIGPFRNLRNFLESPPDEHSPLNGRDLIAKKVKELSVMAGVLSGGAYGSNTEWNVGQDIPSAQIVVQNWPTPIMFSLFEIGWPILADGDIVKTQPQSPVSLALGTQEPRPAWDQTSILYAGRGRADYWDTKTDGRASFNAKGEMKFEDKTDMNHGYLIQKKAPMEMGAIIAKLQADAGKSPKSCPEPVTIAIRNPRSSIGAAPGLLWDHDGAAGLRARAASIGGAGEILRTLDGRRHRSIARPKIQMPGMISPTTP